MTDLLPDDDSFVRTAIQGLRVPVHGPDFWDRLAGQLDDAADDLVAQGLMEEVLRSALVADLAQPEPSPHHVEDPWPEPEVVGRAAEPDLQVDLFGPVDEPVYEDEYEEDLADEAAAYDPTYDEPDAREPMGRRTPGPHPAVDPGGSGADVPDPTRPRRRATEPAPDVQHRCSWRWPSWPPCSRWWRA